MIDPRDIATEIVAREGGFVNDPDDPGGATNYGVTIGTLRRLGLDLTGDGRVDIEDVRAVTPEDAERIYLEHYFRRPGIDRLPERLQAPVFDMQVNSGRAAVRILQRLLVGLGHDIAVDGVIGPRTIAAAEAADRAEPMLPEMYSMARRDWYFRLADRRPALRKYARTRAGAKGGWIRRAEEFLPENLHLTDAEFAERTAAW